MAKVSKATFLKTIITELKKKGHKIKNQTEFKKCFKDYKNLSQIKSGMKKLKAEGKVLECDDFTFDNDIIDFINIKINEIKEDSKKPKKAKKDKKKKTPKTKKDKKKKTPKAKKELTEAELAKKKEFCESWEENKKHVLENKKGAKVVKNPNSNRDVKVGERTYKKFDKECKEIKELLKEEKKEVKTPKETTDVIKKTAEALLCEELKENMKKEKDGKVLNPKTNRLVSANSRTFKKMVKDCDKVIAEEDVKRRAAFEALYNEPAIELKTSEYKLVHVARDGACLFNSTVGFLEHEETGKTLSDSEEEKRAHKLRLQVVKYIKDNPNKKLPNDMTYKELITSDLEAGETFDSYLKEMKKDEIWGGQVEISALSFIFKRTFQVYYLQRGSDIYEQHTAFGQIIKNMIDPVLIYYNSRGVSRGGSHFEYLVPGKTTPKKWTPSPGIAKLDETLLEFIMEFEDEMDETNMIKSFKIAGIDTLEDFDDLLEQDILKYQNFLPRESTDKTDSNVESSTLREQKLIAKLIKYYKANYRVEGADSITLSDISSIAPEENLLSQALAASKADFDKMKKDLKKSVTKTAAKKKIDFKKLEADLKKEIQKRKAPKKAPAKKTPKKSIPKKQKEFKLLLEKVKDNKLTNKDIDDKLKELKLDSEIEYLKQIILLRLETMA